MSTVRQKLEISRTHLFNAGGAVLVALGVVLAVRSSIQPPPEMPLCEARYAGGVLFSFARQNGTPLTPEDLQARLSGLDRGLVANSSIVKDDGVPHGWALEVKLKRAKKDEDDQSKSGIGFTWTPRQLPVAAAACLSYSVWTPEDFKPGEGGLLPGFASDTGVEPITMEPPPETGVPEQPGEGEGRAGAKIVPFSTRLMWRGDNALVVLQAPNMGTRGGVVLDPQKASLKPGRWVRVEEEVVLNTPGQMDGILRVWVDGKLVNEQFGIGFRADELQSLQAVIGDVHHVRQGQWTGAPADTRLRLSPLELRLR